MFCHQVVWIMHLVDSLFRINNKTVIHIIFKYYVYFLHVNSETVVQLSKRLKNNLIS